MKPAWIEAGIVAAVWIVSVLIVGVIVVSARGAQDSMTLATSLLIGAGVATSNVRNAIAAAYTTKQNEMIIEKVQEVKVATNGLSDERAAEARAAGKAEGKAEALASVNAVAPQVVTAVVTKLSEKAASGNLDSLGGLSPQAKIQERKT